jgi:hypothetical protein
MRSTFMTTTPGDADLLVKTPLHLRKGRQGD